MSLTGSELQIMSLHKLYTQSKQQKKKQPLSSPEGHWLLSHFFSKTKMWSLHVPVCARFFIFGYFFVLHIQKHAYWIYWRHSIWQQVLVWMLTSPWCSPSLVWCQQGLTSLPLAALHTGPRFKQLAGKAEELAGKHWQENDVTHCNSL